LGAWSRKTERRVTQAMTRRNVVGLVVTILVALSTVVNGLANSGWWP
jgi:hypothetical protein